MLTDIFFSPTIFGPNYNSSVLQGLLRFSHEKPEGYFCKARSSGQSNSSQMFNGHICYLLEVLFFCLQPLCSHFVTCSAELIIEQEQRVFPFSAAPGPEYCSCLCVPPLTCAHCSAQIRFSERYHHLCMFTPK